MRVFEVLRHDVGPISEEQVIARMKAFDWRYEFSEDVFHAQKAQRELEVIENQVYQLWKKNPEKTVHLWNAHDPFAPADKDATPAFIYRLQAQEEE